MFKSESIFNDSYTRYAVVEQLQYAGKIMLRIWEIYGADDADEKLLVLEHYNSWDDAMSDAYALTGVVPDDVMPT